MIHLRVVYGVMKEGVYTPAPGRSDVGRGVAEARQASTSTRRCIYNDLQLCIVYDGVERCTAYVGFPLHGGCTRGKGDQAHPTRIGGVLLRSRVERRIIMHLVVWGAT